MNRFFNLECSRRHIIAQNNPTLCSSCSQAAETVKIWEFVQAIFVVLISQIILIEFNFCTEFYFMLSRQHYTSFTKSLTHQHLPVSFLFDRDKTDFIFITPIHRDQSLKQS